MDPIPKHPLELADDVGAFFRLSSPLEGRVPCMYLDVLGLVTFGIGNIADGVGKPDAYGIAMAQRHPWRHGVNGQLATPDEVRDAWLKVKRSGRAKSFWRSYALELTDLRLSTEYLDHLVREQLFANERYIVAHHVPYEEWITWPADAQLVCMSLAWALGAGFPGLRPKFWAAMRRRDWAGASIECGLREAGNAGVKDRNVQNRIMLANAVAVDRMGLDPDVLLWPKRVETADDEPTIPAVPHPTPRIELIPLTLPDEWVNDLRKAHNLDGGDI